MKEPYSEADLKGKDHTQEAEKLGEFKKESIKFVLFFKNSYVNNKWIEKK